MKRMRSRWVPSQSSQGRCIGKDARIGPAGQSATYTAFELVLGTIAEKKENIEFHSCIVSIALKMRKNRALDRSQLSHNVQR